MFDHISKIYKTTDNTDNDNIELEFRIKYDFKSDVDPIIKIINEQKQNDNVMVIEKTINCIKSTDQKNTNKIYQVEFGNSDSKSTKVVKTYSKEKLGKPIFDKINGIDIKMSLSREKTIDKFTAESCDLIRMKNRLSIDLSKQKVTKNDQKRMLNKWRLDITLVKSLPYTSDFNLDELETHIAQMFPKNLNIDNYTDFLISSLKNDADLGLEMEIEYINIKTIPTEDDIDDVIKFIKSLDIKPPIAGDMDLYKTLLSRIASWIQPFNVHKYANGTYGIKELATQVVSLDIFQSHYMLIPNMDNYFISPKIDGDRTILIFDHDNDKYFSLSHTAKELNLLDFGCEEKVKKGGDDRPNETILDAEYYTDPKGGGSSYYIFDIIAYKGKSVFDEDYKDRIKYIDKVLDDFAGCTKLIKKPAVNLSGKWKKELEKILKVKWGFETDGWIFTPSQTKGNIKANYIKGRAWKWKPIDVLSIDFLLKSDNKLYSGIGKRITEKIMPPDSWDGKYSDYGPVIFTPTYIPFEKIDSIDVINTINNTEKSKSGVIVELVWKKNKWEMMRIRTDRQIEVDRGNYFGNNHKVAELIWHSIFWPMEPKHFLKSGMTNYMQLSSEVNENRIYFYKLYSYLLRKLTHGYSNKQIHLVDAGIIYPFFNFIVKSGIKNIDFIVSDGFSCLNIIKQKYDRKFISDPSQNIIIRAFKPDDYDVSLKKESIENRKYISFFPTTDQINHIKKASKEKDIEIYIVVSGKQKSSFGKSFSIKNLNSVFSDNNRDSTVKDIYLLHK